MEIKKAQMVRWLKGYSEDMFISLLARETAKAILSEMKRLRRIERAARKWSVFKLSPGDFMDVLYAPKRKAEAEASLREAEPVHLYNAPRTVPVERVRELMQQAHGLGLQHVKLDALLKEVES